MRPILPDFDLFVSPALPHEYARELAAIDQILCVTGRPKCTGNNAPKCTTRVVGQSNRFRALLPGAGQWPDTWKCRNSNNFKH